METKVIMEWWHKMVRRVLCAVSARVKTRKNGGGLLKLHNDIESCGYEDVQIMWEILRTESEIKMSRGTKRKQRWFWKNILSPTTTAQQQLHPYPQIEPK